MALPRVRVPVALDRPRTLVIDFNALCKVEEVTGVPMLVGQPAFSSMRVMRAMVWAGLLHEDPTLTEERVGEMIGDAGPDVVLGSIMEAYMVAMPDDDEDAEERDPSDPTSLRPGEISGQPPDTISG